VLASPLIHAYVRAGRPEEARQVLEDLLALARQRYVTPYKIAAAYAAIGDNPLALDWLERAYQEHDHRLVMLRVEPQFDGLRREPRFIELQRKLARTP
jgi:pentatricopeptide repeat protein